MKIKLILIAFILMHCFTGSISGIELTVTSTFENDNLFKPIKIIETGDCIYLFDTADQSLKVFTKNNALIKTIGRKGGGPGELMNATDFCVTEDNIYILDSYKIEVFLKKDGKHLYSRQLRTTGGIKFCIDGDSFYLSSISAQKGGKLIKKYIDDNRELKLVHSFLDCIPTGSRDLISIYKNFGTLTSQKGNIYFAYLISNKVLEFSRDGKLLNQFTVPIRPVDFKNLKFVQKGNQMRLRLDRGINVELREEGEDLYLLSYDETGDSLICKLEKGEFKEIYRMKEKIISFDISEKEIWALGVMEDIEVLVYKIHGDTEAPRGKKIGGNL